MDRFCSCLFSFLVASHIPCCFVDVMMLPPKAPLPFLLSGGLAHIPVQYNLLFMFSFFTSHWIKALHFKMNENFKIRIKCIYGKQSISLKSISFHPHTITSL